MRIKNLIVTASDELREALSALTNSQLVKRCAPMHRSSPRDSLGATRHAVPGLARRHEALDIEISQLDAELAQLTAHAAPRLLKQPGIGPEIAAGMLLVACDNPPGRATTLPCRALRRVGHPGVQRQDRLNRRGDRQGNSAL